MVLIDIIIQGIYQLLFFYIEDEEELRFKIFRALVIIKVANTKDDEINNTKQLFLHDCTKFNL